MPEVIVLRRGRPDAAPLVVIHPTLEPAQLYGPLVNVISDEVPAVTVPPSRVWASRADGDSRDGQEVPAYADAEYDECLGALERAYPTGGFRLVGWGAGGIAVHALAAKLAEAGRTVEQLVIIDAEPVSEGADLPVIDEPLTYVTVFGSGFSPQHSAGSWRPFVRSTIVDHRVDVDADDVPTEAVWRSIAEIIQG